MRNAPEGSVGVITSTGKERLAELISEMVTCRTVESSQREGMKPIASRSAATTERIC